MGTETNRESADPDGTIAERPGNGTGPAAGSTAPNVDGGSDTAYDATVMAAGQSCSKMERDVAFAAVALKSGRISERQLSKAVSDWTVYGDETLELHLSKKGLISNRDQDVMGAETERVLQNAFDEAAATSAPAGDSLATVHRLDASGRIGRMLGLSLRPDWESHGQERNVIAQYRLLKKLGEGGLGCVWLARDENLQRFVAVKEVNDKARNSPAALMRFRREAEVTGRLEHPSIVPVYQFGEEIEQGRQFYAMRYLGKQTLEDAIAEYHERREAGDHDPMLLHRLLTAFVAICQARSAMHTRAMSCIATSNLKTSRSTTLDR